MSNHAQVNHPFLFLNDDFVAEQHGMSRRPGVPVKHGGNPVLRPTEPWEGRCVILWGSVLFDKHDNVFKMWYTVHNPLAPDKRDRELVCYAYSADGIAWVKPRLGMVEYRGNMDNNIVMNSAGGAFDCPTVARDPFDSPEDEKFKMSLYVGGENPGIRLFLSEDGLTWSDAGRLDLPEGIGDRHFLMADRDAGVWRLYYKYFKHPARQTHYRTVFMAESTDLRSWKDHGEVLVPDPGDPAETEFYGMVAFRDQGVGLGFLEVFDILERKLHTQLVSIDESGLPSRLMMNSRFLNTGRWPEWDSMWAFPGNNAPLRVGEQVRIYYTGRSTLHWALPGHAKGGVEPSGHISAIGLALLRPHGYVCMSAGKEEGELTTVPVTVSGRHMVVNADASEGELRVELLDKDANPLPGYSAGECRPLTRDCTYFKLCFNGCSDLSPLQGKSVRARFRLKNTLLYSFWFSDGQF